MIITLELHQSLSLIPEIYVLGNRNFETWYNTKTRLLFPTQKVQVSYLTHFGPVLKMSFFYIHLPICSSWCHYDSFTYMLSLINEHCVTALAPRSRLVNTDRTREDYLLNKVTHFRVRPSCCQEFPWLHNKPVFRWCFGNLISALFLSRGPQTSPGWDRGDSVLPLSCTLGYCLASDHLFICKKSIPWRKKGACISLQEQWIEGL